MTSPLCTVFQKQEDESMEFLNSKKCEYGVGSMNFSNPVSWHSGAVEGEEISGQQKTDLFLTKNPRSAFSTVTTVAL